MTTLTIEVHRAHMTTATRRWIVAMSAVAVALLVMVVGARHEVQIAKRAACAAELREMQARYPSWRLTGPVAADPCTMIKMVRG